MKSLFVNIADLSRKKAFYLRIKQSPDKKYAECLRFFDSEMQTYLVKPSWTATAQATHFIEPKKHPCGCFWVLVLLCYTKQMLVRKCETITL